MCCSCPWPGICSPSFCCSALFAPTLDVNHVALSVFWASLNGGAVVGVVGVHGVGGAPGGSFLGLVPLGEPSPQPWGRLGGALGGGASGVFGTWLSLSKLRPRSSGSSSS